MRDDIIPKLLGVFDHFLVHIPIIIAIWAGNAELLYFLKLMNPKDAESITTMCTSLFTETRRAPSISGKTRNKLRRQQTWSFCQLKILVLRQLL
jgi:hypothetical protein